MSSNRRMIFFGRSALASLVFAVIALCCGVCPAQTQAAQKVKVNLRPEVVQGTAQAVRPLPAERHMHLTLNLPLRNQDELSGLLQRIYDPASPDFHKFLSVDEFTERFGPSPSDYQAVLSYAKNNGLQVLSTPRNRMLVEVDGRVDRINAALNVSMMEYQHPTGARTFFSADRQPTLNLSVPLVGITGLDSYTPPFRRGLAKDGKSSLGRARTLLAQQAKVTSKNTTTAAYPPNPTGSGPYNSYIPSDFRAGYYGSGPLNGTGQTVGLIEFSGYDPNDIDLFYSTLGLKNTVPLNVVLTGGLTAPMGTGGNDDEPMGDIVFASSVAPHLDQVRIYECCSASYDEDTAGPPLLLNTMASENIAKQMSVSWGWGPEPAVDEPIYQEMAAQGQTMFVATGDYGSPQNPGNDTYNDYSPSDDPWVTAVSMSLLTTKAPGGAWANEIYAGGSGGGYSDGPLPLPIPSWQVPVINFSNNGSTVYRNVPDVVADGFGMFLCGEGQCYPNANCQTCDNGGASFATPIWASLMALANEEAANEGKPSLGFINPVLYKIGLSSQYSQDFHDVIGGNNGCCGQLVYYNAVKGYDLVSGLGSPIGVHLITDLIHQEAAANFSLAPSASSLSIGPNDSTSTTIGIQPSGSTVDPATFSISGLPDGVTASFSSNPATGSSIVTFTSGASPQVGRATVRVRAVAGSQTASTTISLTITSADGNFTIGGPVTAFALPPVSSLSGVVTITGFDGLSSAVTLRATRLPKGVTLSYAQASIYVSGKNESASSVFTITAADTAASGTYTVNLTGTSGSIVNTFPITLAISPVTGTLTATTLAVSPRTNVKPGQAVTLTATITAADSSMPTGTGVQFYDNGVAIGGAQPYANGSSSYLDTNIAAGNHRFTATFTGTGVYAPSTSSAATLLAPLVQAVGSAYPTLTDTVTITNPGTLGQIYVLTTGQPNLDYTYVTGGTCSSGATYAANATCTVNYSFTPKAPGQRLGAVQLVASDASTVLGTTLMSGTGTGAAAVFPGNTGTVTLGNAFINPVGVAVDAAGNVYVADAGNASVKEIVAVGGSTSSSSTVLTLAGGFSYPEGVAVDGAGNVYVSDLYNNTVTEIIAVGGSIPTSNPTMLTLAGGFANPLGVAVDGAGNVYVADSLNNAVKEIPAMGGNPSSSSTVLTLSAFNSPLGVAVDSAGNVYVADNGNKAVKEIVAVGGTVPASNVIVNTLGSGFNSPTGVAVDSAGNVYVADNGANVVEEIIAVGGSIPANNPAMLTLGSGFSGPFGVALDGAGNVYVADSNNNAVKEIPLTTPPSISFPSTAVGSASSPQTVLLQNAGNGALTFPTLVSGPNPFAGSGFVLDNSTTCPQIASGSTAASLAAGSSCNEAVDFQPTQTGTNTSSLLITDNSLGAVDSKGHGTAVQAIALTGTASPPTIASAGQRR